ncbi:MAG TPA: hypothetical protein VF669_05500 [Tepidisphaeraceae bacterium]|jgi:deoxyribose-phosphate aldolase
MRKRLVIFPKNKLENTLYKPEALPAEVQRICADAIRHQMRAVCVTPVYVSRVARLLKGTGVLTSAAIAFPAGTSKSTLKAIESTSTIKDGADEIEVAAHLPHLLNLDLDSARAELMEIARAARSTRPDVFIKVIVELGLLTTVHRDRAEEAINLACRAVRESGCDCLVTATGANDFPHPPPQALDLLIRHAHDIQLKLAATGLDLLTLAPYLEKFHRIGLINAGSILDQPQT